MNTLRKSYLADAKKDKILVENTINSRWVAYNVNPQAVVTGPFLSRLFSLLRIKSPRSLVIPVPSRHDDVCSQTNLLCI